MSENWFRKKWEWSWKSAAQFIQVVTENVSGSKKNALVQENLFQCFEL